jgi:murein DD-endopeptidase MepM/ murein hydrolase activator NlpD
VIDPPFVNPFAASSSVIGRPFIDDGTCNAMIRKGKSGAQEWYNAVAPTILARPWVVAWEAPNEPQPLADWNFCLALADFTSEVTRLLHAVGRKVVAGNISEGNPGGSTEQERSNLFCAIAKGMVTADYWDMHCYWVPDGYPHKEAGFNEWHALRYRLNYGYALAQGIQLPPLFIGECGIDGGIVGRDRYHAGYKAFNLDWQSYQNQHLARLDDEIAKDSYVLAALPFISGGNTDWISFDYEENESRQLAAYIAGKRGVSPSPLPPAPVVPVAPQAEVLMLAPFGLARPLPDNIGSITQGWGENRETYAAIGSWAGHNGLDYGAPMRSPVLACHDGQAFRLYDAAGFGKHIKVMGDGHYTVYGHLDDYNVNDGQAVRTGDVIGLSGNSGWSTGPHLHLGHKVIGVGMPGYLDNQNPLLGRFVYNRAHGIGGGVA